MPRKVKTAALLLAIAGATAAYLCGWRWPMDRLDRFLHERLS